MARRDRTTGLPRPKVRETATGPKALSDRIAERCVASGIFVGGMGLGFGILQAACMVP